VDNIAREALKAKESETAARTRKQIDCVREVAIAAMHGF